MRRASRSRATITWILRTAAAIGLVFVAVTCSFTPPATSPPGIPPANSLFVGCYQGAITSPPGNGSVVVVLEGPADPADQLTLSGCIRTTFGARQQLATLSGTVQDVREQAKLTAMPTAGDAPFDLQIDRRPAGDLVAERVDVNAEAGALFTTAANLPRCAPALSCAELATSMRPAPQPVLEIP